MKLDDFRKLSEMNLPQTEEGYAIVAAWLKERGIDPSNVYQELEMSSRYVNTHRDTTHSNARVNLHSHTYAEILYCRSCEGVEYLIGSDRYRLRKGDIIYVPPGVSHRPILPEKLTAPYERDVLWISGEFIKTIQDMFPEDSDPIRKHRALIRTAGTRWEFLGDLFRNGVLEEERKRSGWETAVVGNTLMIYANMKRIYLEQSAGSLEAEKPDLLDKVTAYIERHYAEHITVSDLSRRYYVSNSTISHQFKEKMGISIYRYLTQRRLISAKNRIAEGVPLEQVAVRVGFSDYSAFYRAFKQEYGISPRQYRTLQEGKTV